MAVDVRHVSTGRPRADQRVKHGINVDRRASPVPSCRMDANGCVALSSILEAFNEPLNEEQAWALCYQAAKFLHANRSQPYHLASPSDLLIHKEGPVSVTSETPDSQRRKSPEKKLLSALGIVLYNALDFGCDEHEERQLEPSLAALIEKLTTADECGRDSCDEGIVGDDAGEDDQGSSLEVASSSGLTLEKVVEICSSHLARPDSADGHYTAVCRALVNEAQELSTFLSQISKGTQSLQETETESCSSLDELRVIDWSRIWMQVIRELRNGVKLKKVDNNSHHLHPIEFELTPYEMLLDDIRSQRYKLNKVMVNAGLPTRLKKDAHEMILEFIRSRPPLVPASRRQLPPAPNDEQSLHERLMLSIRKDHRLRPTPTPERLSSSCTSLRRLVDEERVYPASGLGLGRSNEHLTSSGGNESAPSTGVPRRKKLIKADLQLSFEEDDDQSAVTTSCWPHAGHAKASHEDDEDELHRLGRSGSCEPASDEPPSSFTRRLSQRFGWLRKGSKEQERRHSIAVPGARRALQETTSGVDGGQHPAGQQSSTSGGGTSAADRESNNNRHNLSKMHQSSSSDSITSMTTLQRDSNGLWAAYDYPSLTLEEFKHIRTVLTKAELESLWLTKELREDVEKGKVCFTCLKQRFSIFGPWSVCCKLCERLICTRCATTMHIPAKSLSKIPIAMLSPSTPSSPVAESLPTDVDEENLENMKPHKKSGPVMKLCRDCKHLVAKVIDASLSGCHAHSATEQSDAPRCPSAS